MMVDPPSPVICPCSTQPTDPAALNTWALCRKRCNFDGLRNLACSNASTIFVSAIYACVDSALATSAEFTANLIKTRACQGGVFTSLLELQRLRFCDVVNGDLIIEDLTFDIDATVFWDITTVTGSLDLSCGIC